MKFYKSEEYQPSCQKLFDAYKAKIQTLIPQAKVEHIGASSIPNAISKGDLDVYIGVERHEFEWAIKQLLPLGFTVKTDTLRTPELCMLESKLDDNLALQVVVNGSEFESFLVFRDRLRANSQLVQEYNKLKMACQGLAPNDYREKKSAFIELVLFSA